MSKNTILYRGALIFLALALAVLLPVQALGVDVFDNNVRNEDVSDKDPISGTCGNGLSWRLEDGHLEISGSGPMADYYEGAMAPWYSRRAEITAITIGNGVTAIGSLAFYQCENVTDLVLPDSVTTIGSIAFAQCFGLERVQLGTGLTAIGYAAFEECKALAAIRLPAALTAIGERAFFHCTSLGGIIIPAGCMSLGPNAFAYCTSMAYAKIEAPLPELPYWLFYGCTNLNTLYIPETVENIQDNALNQCPNLSNVDYGGSDAVREQIREAYQESREYYTGIFQEGEYVQTDNSDILITDTTYEKLDEDGEPIPGSTNISATLNNQEGWKDVVGAVIGQQDSYTPPQTDVYGSDMEIGKGTLTDLAGQEGQVTVHTPTNAEWVIRLEDQDADALGQKQNFSVSMQKNDSLPKKWNEVVGDSTSYTVDMNGVSLNVTVSLPVGKEFTYGYATLYNSGMQAIHSTVIDENGKANFDLAGVEKGSYVLVINAPKVGETEIVIPENLYGQFGMDFSDGTLMDSQGNRYKITRRTSALPFTLTQLMVGVMVAMVAVAVVVGTIMVIRNRKKLMMNPMGYEDEEE